MEGGTVLAFIIGVVVLVLGLALSIALHELGHLIPAKLFGVRVSQYMIGFGPTLWSRKIGETEYGVKWIPLGGYISMAGMYPPSPRKTGRAGRAGSMFFSTLVQEARDANDETMHGADDPRTYYRLPVYKRVIIMLGGPLMNFVFAILLFVLLFSGIGIQTATSTIDSVTPCLTTTATAQCAPGDPASPAQAAGLQDGDTIISIDGAPVTNFADIVAIVQASPGRSLTFVVNRGGQELTVPVTPAATTLADGKTVGRIGTVAAVDYVRESPAAAVQNTLEYTGQVTGVIVQLPVRVWQAGVDLFTGAPRDPNGPISIVGAGSVAGQVAAAEAPITNRVAAMLQLLASLNIALFVFNLIPLLPLDGGHVAVALWDGIKRAWAKLFRRPPPKPVDASKLAPVTFIAVCALLVMGAVLILADIFNPVSLFR